MSKRLNKGDKIEHDNKTWQCICEDNEVAVLGLDFGDSVSYEFTICVSNVEMDDGFEFKKI